MILPVANSRSETNRNVAATTSRDLGVPGWPRVTARAGFRQWQQKRAHEFIKSAIKVAEESTGERDPLQIDSKVIYSATVPTLVGLSKEVEMFVVGYRVHGGALARIPRRQYEF